MLPVVLAMLLSAPMLSEVPASPKGGDESVETETVARVGHDPCLAASFAEMLRGAHGNMEVAAFIVDDGGVLRLLLWPRMAWVRSQSYTGRFPDHVIAIAHTHPPDGERPSVQDAIEAAKLQVPNFVVTSSAVWVVDPRLEPHIRQVAAKGWLRNLSRDCGRLQAMR